MNAYELGTPIIYQEAIGHIIGRSRESNPRYDIMLKDRRVINSLPPEVFEVK